MQRLLQWIDRIPLIALVGLAVFLGVAPIKPEPHLVEKIGMLMNGTLTRPIDIFDLFWHSWPIALLVLRLVRMRRAG